MAEKAKTPFVNVTKKMMLPKAPYKFPALTKPDTSTFSLGKCKDGVYKTGVLYKQNSDFIKKLTAELDALYERGVAEVAKAAATMPTASAKDKTNKKAFETIYPKNDYFKVDTDKEGNETGYVALNVKLSATTGKGVRNSFVLIDAAKNNLNRATTEIWGGTEGITQVNAKFYNLAGPKQSGVSFELLGVQIINLVGPNGGSREQGSADDFGTEEGYAADTESSDDDATPKDGADETAPF
ncbi:hypothetical protein UFOVP823_52 [uncultured Caudovirales phage]|uniref:Uncharacterized protein n=1 Tax=uncultured Caudovirales phage TaxID=2100421 RepID=A0A6J5PD47_9CAUD|nr:hypothetical protein UFOVP823_52 [uncultured Caudovirales phage]